MIWLAVVNIFCFRSFSEFKCIKNATKNTSDNHFRGQFFVYPALFLFFKLRKNWNPFLSSEHIKSFIYAKIYQIYYQIYGLSNHSRRILHGRIMNVLSSRIWCTFLQFPKFQFFVWMFSVHGNFSSRPHGSFSMLHSEQFVISFFFLFWGLASRYNYYNTHGS